MRRHVIIGLVLASAVCWADSKTDKIYANMRRLALSSEICIGQLYRTKALAGIAKERHYSSLGGVLKLKALADLQDDVRSADERIALARRELKEEKTSALPCKHKAVAPVIECRVKQEQSDDDSGNSDPDDVCSDSDFRQLLGTIHEYLQSVKEGER